MTEPRCLIVCTGKDCTVSKGHSKMVTLAMSVDGSMEIACQDICKGPVAGVRDERGIRWYSKMRGRQRREQLLTALGTGHVPDELRAREARKRRNRIRHEKRMSPLG